MTSSVEATASQTHLMNNFPNIPWHAYSPLEAHNAYLSAKGRAAEDDPIFAAYLIEHLQGRSSPLPEDQRQAKKQEPTYPAASSASPPPVDPIEQTSAFDKAKSDQEHTNAKKHK